MRERLKNVIALLADLCLGIYMVHTVIENILPREIGLTTLSFAGILSVPAITIIIYAISVVIVFLISRVSLLRKCVL